ncbi:RDD family protein [Pseudomonas sp. NPDC089534]|uniref:RDD family protein n=1 Tax=Pseudomonas sp. NPDC089534 TaxID=3364468 RepID=UPI00380C8AC2
MEVARTSLMMRRMGAYIVDMSAIVITLHGMNLVDLYFGWIFQTAVYLLYFALAEWRWSGKTPGKFVFRIAVINGAGDPPTFIQALIRGITRHIEALLGIITLFILTHSDRCQRVGDMLARTYVIPTKDLAQIQTAIRDYRIE